MSEEMPLKSPLRNVLLTIAYDGSGFSGWQRQPNQRTVQGELERVLSHLCGEEIALNGVSRTDAGVHALGQRASFTGGFGIPAERIPAAANNLLEDIRIVCAEEMPPGFRIRDAVRAKTYVYRMAWAEGGTLAPLFLRNYFAWLPAAPDAARVRAAAAALVGTHDFAAFQSAGGMPRETTVRTIYKAKVLSNTCLPACFSSLDFADKRDNSGFSGFDFAVTGDGFLYNMVRIMAGTLIECGLGQRDPVEMADILRSADRRRAGRTAPPQGLYLKEVFFDQENADLD